MDDVTTVVDSSDVRSGFSGVVSFGHDVFTYDPAKRPWVSSGGKRVYRGMYYRGDMGCRESIPAVAKFYGSEAVGRFGREAAALARGSMIGVGPKLLQVSTADEPDWEMPVPVIVEEYVGCRLSDALAGSAIPASNESAETQYLLKEAGEARQKQVAKIAYDLMLHVHRMHSNGVCHGDLKASNVCLRAIGPRPWDVRATLIDFDLEAPVGSPAPYERTAAYYDTLFRRVPKALGAAGDLLPTLVELDLACLSALCLEVETGCRIDVLDATQIVDAFERGIGLFCYTKTGAIRAWSIDPEQHLTLRAEQAGLLPLERYFAGCGKAFMKRALAIAQAELKGSRFLDAQDIRAIEANPEMELIRRQDAVAHAVFASYRKNLIAAGETPDYETFEQQPLDLQLSCYGQAADLCDKVVRLGYALERACPTGNERALDGFDEKQVDTMARWEHERWLTERMAMGWTYGPMRDAQKKTSPYLVPYDELDEQAKETRNRAFMRDTLQLLSAAGLVAVSL